MLPPARRIRLGVVFAFLAGMTLAAGCGSPGAQPSTQGLPCFQYASAQWHFSIKYPVTYRSTEGTGQTPAPGGGFAVSFVDTTTGLHGSDATAISVVVGRLNRPAKAKDVWRARGAVNSLMARFTEGYEALRIVTPLERVRLGSYPAWRTSFVFVSPSGRDMVNLSYITLHDSFAYWIYAQTSREYWSSRRRELSTSLASFRLQP